MTSLHPTQLQIIAQLEQRVARLPSSTDHLMLLKWRLLSAAQYLIGYVHDDIRVASQNAVATFIAYGPGSTTDKALSELDKAITAVEGRPPAVLPFISEQKKVCVSNALNALTARGPEIVEEALNALPHLRQRLATGVQLTSLLPGLKYRFELVAAIVENALEKETARIKAAAGLLYFHQLNDEIPDAAGLIGVMDDDHALRVVMEELGRSKPGGELHWSEKVCSLWYDMPFLMGQNVQRKENVLATSWLDRLNCKSRDSI